MGPPHGGRRRVIWASGTEAKRTFERPRDGRTEVAVSFREITMQDVREVLRRAQAGQGIRQIARETGLDRKTDPTLNAAFKDYTTARGLFADTARVRHPQDKPR